MSSTNFLKLPAILSGTEHYGDDGVTWEGAPVSADAVRLAVTRIKRLRRKQQNRPRPDFCQLQIADTLAGCEDGRRCLNGACPDCSRALQRWLTQSIVTLAGEVDADMTIIALTLISALPLAEAITANTLKDMLTDVRSRVASVPFVKAAVLCADVSYNDFAQIAGANWIGPTEGWQPHVHGIVWVESRDDAKKLKSALKKLFPRTQSIRLPVYGSFYDGSTEWASYILKYEYQRRVSYFDTKTGTLSASDYDLTAAQDVMVMRAISELGLGGRIELIGIHTVEDQVNKHIRLNIIPKMIG